MTEWNDIVDAEKRAIGMIAHVGIYENKSS